jgi:hypothetical protein
MNILKKTGGRLFYVTAIIDYLFEPVFKEKNDQIGKICQFMNTVAFRHNGNIYHMQNLAVDDYPAPGKVPIIKKELKLDWEEFLIRHQQQLRDKNELEWFLAQIGATAKDMWGLYELTPVSLRPAAMFTTTTYVPSITSIPKELINSFKETHKDKYVLLEQYTMKRLIME